MGFLDRSREQRALQRQTMNTEVVGHLDRAVKEAEAGNIEAEEAAIRAAHEVAIKHDGFTQSGTDYFNERMLHRLNSGTLRRSEYLGNAGDVHVWRDRILLFDQDFEVRRMDGEVRASVETAGQLVRSRRPTLTRMMVGSVLPGTALIPGLALQKQDVNDTRALFFVLEHPEWGRMIQVAPDYEAGTRQLAQMVNQAARELAHVKAQNGKAAEGRADTLDALKQLGELRDAAVLTDAEFEAKKAQLLAEL
jgi:hypothetical protein